MHNNDQQKQTYNQKLLRTVDVSKKIFFEEYVWSLIIDRGCCLGEHSLYRKLLEKLTIRHRRFESFTSISNDEIIFNIEHVPSSTSPGPSL